MEMLEFHDVKKSFGNVDALKQVSFSVPTGAMFGLLGPNGAGKTTLIRIITNIIAADQGTITCQGKSLADLGKQFIGYMPEEKGMYKKMKVGEHLVYLGQLKGLSKKEVKERIAFWFDRLKITDWWDKKIQDLSKGMQQKVQFIATVLHQPGLLILDEPFSGLDPINTEVIKEQIFYLNQQGTTILFSTHRMEQVEEICENVVLIDRGSVLVNDGVDRLKETYKKGIYDLSYSGSTLPESNLYEVLKESENNIRIKKHESVSTNDILKFALESGLSVNGFKEILPSLNEIFIDLVNKNEHA